MNINNDKIKVVELFAGVGGFRLALERTSQKFDTIWANQWEPGKKVQWAYDCYIKHFGPSTSHVNQDISKVIDEVPNHDLLVGGFPCQDYSVARTNADGIEGKKGVLWWSIRDIFVSKKPKLILLENVDRLIKSPGIQPGRDFGIMLRSLHDAGYNVEWRVINAAEYGFVQKRRRVFIFAFRKELTESIYHTHNQIEILTKEGFFSKQFPVQADFKNNISITTILNGFKDLVDVSTDFEYKFHNSGSMIDGQITTIELYPVQVQAKTLLDIIEMNGVDDKYYLNGTNDKLEKLKDKKSIRRIDPEGEIYFYSEGKMEFPDPLDRPARTMLTSEGSINRSTHVIKDPKTQKLRILTPLECERINGFDDNWTDTGMPYRFRYFCMGNALVVPLVEIMAKGILNIWKEIKSYE